MPHFSSFVPCRRVEGLISEDVEGETLLYAEESHRAFCLNPAAARVWASIDGSRNLLEIGLCAALSAEAVNGVLRDLAEAGLLAEAPESSPSEVDLARRRLVGAGLVALPFIMAVTVPRAAEAASACTVGIPGGPACSPTTPCCSGLCNENLGTCG